MIHTHTFLRKKNTHRRSRREKNTENIKNIFDYCSNRDSYPRYMYTKEESIIFIH